MPLSFQKKCQGKNWENVGILKRLQKRRAFFLLLKVSFKAPPRFYFNFFYDQAKKTAYPCFEKIIYIFCGYFYYCDSFAYGVGVM